MGSSYVDLDIVSHAIQTSDERTQEVNAKTRSFVIGKHIELRWSIAVIQLESSVQV